ncbi:hypothetical protein L1987_69027 [Smallanthus sonchifolius]|uniref:Uncharacterized protein n=1 Tax=Smallanthus sonchifolius TaxID=185202 RepID=A0ACB9B4Y1_9ASTR|nr:hypothetical protein L1987_69027 [Smallanthus sonchifolius]
MEGEWQEERRRKQNNFTGQKKWRKTRSGRGETSFFVSNLPEGIKAKELEDCFCSFGRVVDVYVASKKDKAGSYFGFVRFTGVSNKWDLERSMRDVKMNNLSLSVNLAKVDRDGKPANSGEDKELPHSHSGGSSFHQKGNDRWEGVVGDKPYLRALIGKQNNSVSVGEIKVPEDADSVVLQWYDLSVVGITRDFTHLGNLQELMDFEEDKDMTIRYLGGLQVLITFKKETHAKEFANNKNSWSKWFSEVQVWTGQSLISERIVWLKIFGVPAHLWDANVFDAIAAKSGKVLAPSQASFSDGDLTQDTVGILVGEGWRLPEVGVLKWRDKSYRVWFKEDEGNWTPRWITTTNSNKQATVIGQMASGKEPKEENSQAKTCRNGTLEGRQLHAHGDVQQSRMETGALNASVTDPIGCFNDIFFFESTRPINSPAQEKHPSKQPNAILDPVAQRITQPRKRRRTEQADSDPFCLDEIIRGENNEIGGSGLPSGQMLIPDLNSSMASLSPAPEDVSSGTQRVQVPNHTLVSQSENGKESHLDQEIKATISYGREVGVDLQNKEELVRSVILGEGESHGYQ